MIIQDMTGKDFTKQAVDSKCLCPQYSQCCPSKNKYIHSLFIMVPADGTYISYQNFSNSVKKMEKEKLNHKDVIYQQFC